MIITISSLKGGVGKSTITQNLAVCFAHQGYKVAIVDSDVNQSCIEWVEDRSEALPYIYVSTLPDGKALSKGLIGLNENYDIILIDGTPSINAIASRIITVADLLLIPIKAGKMDLKATQKFIDRYDQAVETKGEEIPVYFLFNEYKQGQTLTQTTEKILDGSDIQTLKAHCGSRTAYGQANEIGKGVYEYKDKKAKAEIVALVKELTGIMEKL